MPGVFANSEWVQWDNEGENPYEAFGLTLMDDGTLEASCVRQYKGDRDADNVTVAIPAAAAPAFLVALQAWTEQLPRKARS